MPLISTIDEERMSMISGRTGPFMIWIFFVYLSRLKSSWRSNSFTAPQMIDLANWCAVRSGSMFRLDDSTQ